MGAARAAAVGSDTRDQGASRFAGSDVVPETRPSPTRSERGAAVSLISP